MYVVKVGEYYVKSAELIRKDSTRTLCISDILLSQESMRNFDKNIAEIIAKKTNGEIIEISMRVDKPEYEQLSLFDKEEATNV